MILAFPSCCSLLDSVDDFRSLQVWQDPQAPHKTYVEISCKDCEEMDEKQHERLNNLKSVYSNKLVVF